MWEMLSVTDTALRFLLYISTISAAGSVLLLALTYRRSEAAAVHAPLWQQMHVGAFALLIVESLRFWLFARGFDYNFTFMLNFGSTAAILTRLGAATLLLLLIPARRIWLLLPVAIAIIGAYALEGHAVSVEDGRLPAIVLQILLFAHLLVIHWWFAVLWPLRSLTAGPVDALKVASELFGSQAETLVLAGLVIGGTVFFGFWTSDAEMLWPYLIAFGTKLGGMLLILMIAAKHKQKLVPELTADTTPGFRRSLTTEIILAALILLATAFAINLGLA